MKRDLKSGLLEDSKPTAQTTGGAAGLFQPTTKQEQPPRQYGRMCAVVNTSLQAKLQEIAHLHKLTFKEVLEAAMQYAVDKYEHDHGRISTPETPKGGKLF